MQILQKHIDILNDVRAGKIPLKTFFFKRSKDENDCDLHRQKRANLIIALQYAPLPSDEPLLQELFRQEIKLAENDSEQGLSDTMVLNAALLARFKNPENALLFTAAKRANFDTSCGFDYEFLVSAGIDATYETMDNAKNSKLKTIFYRIVGDSREGCLISPEELQEWEKVIQRRLDTSSPDTLEKEISLAIQLNEKEGLRALVDRWKAQHSTWTTEDANELLYYEVILKNLEGQIYAYQLIAELDTRESRRTHAKEKLCQLYLQNGQPLNAWDTLQLVLTSPRDMDRFGGDTVAMIFNLALAFDKQHPIAKASFSLAMQEIDLLPPAQRYRELAQAARKAAIHMEDAAAAATIEEILAPE